MPLYLYLAETLRVQGIEPNDTEMYRILSKGPHFSIPQREGFHLMVYGSFCLTPLPKKYPIFWISFLFIIYAVRLISRFFQLLFKSSINPFCAAFHPLPPEIGGLWSLQFKKLEFCLATHTEHTLDRNINLDDCNIFRHAEKIHINLRLTHNLDLKPGGSRF